MDNIYGSELPSGMLMRAIQNEQDQIAYYEPLCAMAPDAEIKMIIENILADEKHHLEIFAGLFFRLFGEMPDLQGGITEKITCFTEGVKRSILIERESFEFYNKLYLQEQSNAAGKIFMHIMLDEQSHFEKLSYIYEKLNE